MTVETTVNTGRKVYVPARGESAVAGKRLSPPHAVKSKTSAEAPMHFYARVSKRADVRNILERLAKD